MTSDPHRSGLAAIQAAQNASVDPSSADKQPRPVDWAGFFASAPKVSADFMAEDERLPPQERVLHLSSAPIQPSTPQS